MEHQNESRCGYCDHVSVNNNNRDSVWSISGTLRTYLDGTKHYLRWCCYEAYVSGNQWWGTYEMRAYLKNKHPYPKTSKILLLGNIKFIVYELKTKPKEESVKFNNGSTKLSRFFSFNSCSDPHEIVTNGVYKKRLEKTHSAPLVTQCSEPTCHYIYLLIEREFINSNQLVYKVGKTTQRNYARFKDYPKGSEVLLYLKCNDCHSAERAILDLFKSKYEPMVEYGYEYFRGSPNLMMNDICALMIQN